MNRKDRRAAGKRFPRAGPITAAADEGARLFALAVHHHHAGQLAQAEDLYRQALAIDRRHFGSLHHLGIMALQRGRPHAAVEEIGRAIAINDRVPDCRYNMGFALQSVGRLEEAASHYREAVRLKPDYIEAHTKLGNVLRELGRNDEALAVYERVIGLSPSAQAHYNLANTLAGLERLDEAVGHYRQALAFEPDLAELHNNLANALVAQNRLEEALVHLRRALALAPRLVEAHVNLGAALLQQGQPEEAAAALEEALSIDPDFADAHSNLGNVLLAQGRLERAGQCYQRALALEPELAGAHNNLGIVLLSQGRCEEASEHFERALACDSGFVEAYNNLARAVMALGRPENALAVLRRALATAEAAETRSLFVQCAKMLAVPPDEEGFRGLMIRALSEPWGRSSELAPVAARLLRQDRTIATAIERLAKAHPRQLAAAELLGEGGLAELSRNRLLRCLMESATVGDVELERFLTALRSALLALISANDAAPLDEAAGELCCSMARQCFLNEQVFACGAEEMARAVAQRDAVAAALAADGAIAESRLALAACYFPLHTLAGSERLLDRQWSAGVANLLVHQIAEPAEEQRLRASIPRLTDIEDAVSRAVQQQYEANPYPRWVKADPPKERLTLDQYLRRRLPAAAFTPLGRKSTDILVAGCGTGQHAIETAQRFAAARVLAIDLSLASLAFAVRKSRALGRTDIEYAQADILRLGALDRSFDLVEASGVLHHLADPLAGWRILLSLLRPGGFMAVGLYSAVARAGIREARSFIAGRGYRPTVEDIRRCRQDLVALDGGDRFGNVAASDDFFSTSACRDLLFHVQEQQLTTAQIAQFIADNDLSFLGFDLAPITMRRYLARYPHDIAMTDLSAWNAFEREHPATFSGMYQFWVQKKPG